MIHTCVTMMCPPPESQTELVPMPSGTRAVFQMSGWAHRVENRVCSGGGAVSCRAFRLRGQVGPVGRSQATRCSDRSFSEHLHDDTTKPGTRIKIDQDDLLPRTQLELTVDHRDSETRTE